MLKDLIKEGLLSEQKKEGFEVDVIKISETRYNIVVKINETASLNVFVLYHYEKTLKDNLEDFKKTINEQIEIYSKECTYA